MSRSMPLPSPEAVAARTRAALAYANIKLTEKGEPVSVGAISQPTMARIISPTNPRGVRSVEELWAIADACGVPRSFMEEGFSSVEPDGLLVRLEALEGQADEIHRLRATVDALVAVMDRQLAEKVRADAERALQQESGTTGQSGHQRPA